MTRRTKTPEPPKPPPREERRLAKPLVQAGRLLEPGEIVRLRPDQIERLAPDGYFAEDSP